MEKKTLTTREELEELCNCSALTWEGMSLDDENIKDIGEWLTQHGVDISNAVLNIISGKLMNSTYKLTGTNAYPDDLNIVSITGIDVGPIIIARFQVGARWFDDIVDNNAEREKEFKRARRRAEVREKRLE